MAPLGALTPGLKELAAKLPEDLKGVCLEAVNKGKLDRNNYRFDHDRKKVAEAKARKARRQARARPRPAPSASAPRAARAPRAAAAARAAAASRRRPPPSVRLTPSRSSPRDP